VTDKIVAQASNLVALENPKKENAHHFAGVDNMENAAMKNQKNN